MSAPELSTPDAGVARVVLDVDTGIDDALALLYAAASPGLDLVGVTTVTGNVSADIAARNSAAVLAVAGADHVPVAVGAMRTTAGSGPRTGPTNHGPDGLGGVRVPPEAAPSRSDVAALVRSAAASGPLTLVGMAPMTNLPALAAYADRTVLVGGELVVEDPPELNAGHDPDATASTIAVADPTTLYVIDVFERVGVDVADVRRLRSSNQAAARLAGELLAVRRSHLVGDAGALVLLTRPHLFRVERRRFGVVGERLVETPDGRLIDVVVDVDARAVATEYVATLLGEE